MSNKPTINDLDSGVASKAWVNGFGIGGVSKQVAYQSDLNTLTTTGLYYTNACTNTPTSLNGYVIVQAYNSTYISQIFTEYDNGTTYVRVNNNGTWGSWSRLAAFSDFGDSAGTNGYQKLPSGIIVQWGSITQTGTTSGMTVTFPIAFPSVCTSATATIYDSNAGTATPGVWITGKNASSIYVRCNANWNFCWMAVGY